MRLFSITTLGCKVNQYDGAAVAEALTAGGWERAELDQSPDLVVVNTCCVTTTAMRKCRQTIRKQLRGAASEADVCILGCYSTYHRDKIRELLAELDIPEDRIFILGLHEDIAGSLAGLLQRQPSTPLQKTPGRPQRLPQAPKTLKKRRCEAVADDVGAARNLPAIRHFPGHQRAFVKVQDGCDAFCTYCVVPFTRAVVWSKSIAEVVAECRGLIASGHREIVLCGVFLGAFGRDTTIRRRWDGSADQLPELLRAVAKLDGLWRVRLSSLEPGDLTSELLSVAASHSTVAPHFHLPLQSGSQQILQKMNRQYFAEDFAETVRKLRARLDRPAITTDIIVGFPGESEEDFAATLELVRRAGFAKIHAFPFSAIEPTAAWRHRRQAPPPQTIKQRMKRLAELEAELATDYRRQFVGQTMEALVESTGPDSRQRQAMTDRYLTVEFACDSRENLTGRVVKLEIEAPCPAGLRGKIAQ